MTKLAATTRLISEVDALRGLPLRLSESWAATVPASLIVLRLSDAYGRTDAVGRLTIAILERLKASRKIALRLSTSLVRLVAAHGRRDAIPRLGTGFFWLDALGEPNVTTRSALGASPISRRRSVSLRVRRRLSISAGVPALV